MGPVITLFFNRKFNNSLKILASVQNFPDSPGLHSATQSKPLCFSCFCKWSADLRLRKYLYNNKQVGSCMSKNYLHLQAEELLGIS